MTPPPLNKKKTHFNKWQKYIAKYKHLAHLLYINVDELATKNN